LKQLEEPYIYDIKNDELYELNEDGFQFLVRCCLGEQPPIKKDDEPFIEYCVSENLITISDIPIRKFKSPQASPVPSLRYLELQITNRCNLHCRHCYIGNGLNQDLTIETIEMALEEFEQMQGLRLLLSGGEPFMHPFFWQINDILERYEFRSVLLSNGTFIDRDVAKRLRVHEVQLSIDGMKQGHEAVRGHGTFEKTLSAIDCLQEQNICVSVATMIHRGNLNELDELNSLLESKNIIEWNVDVPCMEGRLKENQKLSVSPQETARCLQYGHGGGFHGSDKNAACGAHLCAILPDGMVAKCGLFSQEPVGFIGEGLRVCWERLPRILLSDLNCHCPELEECRGGCRFRANLNGDLLQPDLYQCYTRGVLKGGDENEDQEGGEEAFRNV